MRRAQVPLKALWGALAAGTLGGTYAYRQRNSQQKPDTSALAENSQNKKESKSPVCEIVCSSDPAEKNKVTNPESKKPTGNWLGKFLLHDEANSEEAKPMHSSTIPDKNKADGSYKTPKDWQIRTFDPPSLQQESEAQFTDKPGIEAQAKIPNWLDGLSKPQEDESKAFSDEPPNTDFRKHKSGNPPNQAEDQIRSFDPPSLQKESEPQLTDKPDIAAQAKIPNRIDEVSPQEDESKAFSAKPPNTDFGKHKSGDPRIPDEDLVNKPGLEAKSNKTNWLGGPQYEKPRKENSEQIEKETDSSEFKPEEKSAFTDLPSGPYSKADKYSQGQTEDHKKNDLEIEVSTAPKTNKNDDLKRGFSQDDDNSKQAQRDSDPSTFRHPIKEKDFKEPLWKCETSEKSAQPITSNMLDYKDGKKDFEKADDEKISPDSNVEEPGKASEDVLNKNNSFGGHFFGDDKPGKEKQQNDDETPDSNAKDPAKTYEDPFNKNNSTGGHFLGDDKPGKEKQIEDETVVADSNAKEPARTSDDPFNRNNLQGGHFLGGDKPIGEKQQKVYAPDSNAGEPTGAPEDHSDKNNLLGGLYSQHGKDNFKKTEEDERNSDASKPAGLPEINSNSTNWSGSLLPHEDKSREETSKETVSQDLKPDANTSGRLGEILPDDDKPRKEDFDQREDGTSNPDAPEPSGSPETKSTGWLGWLFPKDDKSGKENSDQPEEESDLEPEKLAGTCRGRLKTDGGSETCICVKTEAMKKAFQNLSSKQVCQCD